MPSKAMTTPPEDAIRTRAYLMWEADGRPFGNDDHYWGLAVAALTVTAPRPKRAAAAAEPAERTARAAAKPAKAAAKPAAKAKPKK